MNRSDLVDLVMQAGQVITRKAAESILDTVLEEIKETIADGEPVSITNFGVFEQRHRAARMARNPKAGTPVEVPATKVVVFRPAPVFKQLVANATEA